METVFENPPDDKTDDGVGTPQHAPPPPIEPTPPVDTPTLEAVRAGMSARAEAAAKTRAIARRRIASTLAMLATLVATFLVLACMGAVAVSSEDAEGPRAVWHMASLAAAVCAQATAILFPPACVAGTVAATAMSLASVGVQVYVLAMDPAGPRMSRGVLGAVYAAICVVSSVHVVAVSVFALFDASVSPSAVGLHACVPCASSDGVGPSVSL